MKNKFLLVLSAFALLSAGAMAQTQYETARLTGSELNGTARFVGMGGAMGALGADISTMNTNPAGIGLYRSNEISTSFGFNNTQTKSGTYDSDRTRWSWDQLGFVYSHQIGTATDLRFVNFGFNYHKSKNFNRAFAMQQDLRGFGYTDGYGRSWTASQTQQMANMVGLLSAGQIDDVYNYGDVEGLQNPYNVYDYPYLGVMGIRSELVGIDEYERPMGWNGKSNGYIGREIGGLESYDLNLAFNIKDRFYLGLTMGINNVNYRMNSYYTEDIYDGPHSGFYELENYYRLEGAGVDLKVGAIFRPIADSPFRIGAAIHTPMWYTLTEKYTAQVYDKLTYDFGEPELEQFECTEAVEDYVNGVTLRDYEMTTPWKFQLSAGTTIANMIAVGAEYEFQDYSTARLRYENGEKNHEQNANVKEDLKGVHTLRVGMEARLAPSFSVRAGYNYTSAPFRKTAYKALDYNDMRTDVDYTNTFERNTVTVGLGYSGNVFFADLAYKYDMYKSEFYAFSADALQPVKTDNNRHQVLLTMGVRF